MKILHVIETLGVGGAERLLVMMLPELRRRGEDVAVAVLKEPLDLKTELEAAGVPVHVLPPHHKWNLLAGAANIAHKARELDSDIIHAHLYFPSVYTGLARKRGLCAARTCSTFHNLAYLPGVNKPGPGLWLRRKLQAHISPLGFDGLIANSTPVADHYRTVLGLSKVSVIHNPVDFDVIERVAEKCARQPDPSCRKDDSAPLRIVLPGRLVHEKGHRDLLDAISRLRADGCAFETVFAGGGPLRGEIEAAVRAHGLEDGVRFTGTLAHDQLLEEVARADIVVVPSRFEGFGLTALEAMALSRPVIASDTGGLREVVVDEVTGLLVPPADPAALKTALARLASDPALRRHLGDAGRLRAERHFALPQFADALQAVYRDMTAGHHTACAGRRAFA